MWNTPLNQFCVGLVFAHNQKYFLSEWTLSWRYGVTTFRGNAKIVSYKVQLFRLKKITELCFLHFYAAQNFFAFSEKWHVQVWIKLLSPWNQILILLKTESLIFCCLSMSKVKLFSKFLKNLLENRFLEDKFLHHWNILFFCLFLNVIFCCPFYQ